MAAVKSGLVLWNEKANRGFGSIRQPRTMRAFSETMLKDSFKELGTERYCLFWSAVACYRIRRTKRVLRLM